MQLKKSYLLGFFLAVFGYQAIQTVAIDQTWEKCEKESNNSKLHCDICDEMRGFFLESNPEYYSKKSGCTKYEENKIKVRLPDHAVSSSINVAAATYAKDDTRKEGDERRGEEGKAENRLISSFGIVCQGELSIYSDKCFSCPSAKDLDDIYDSLLSYLEVKRRSFIFNHHLEFFEYQSEKTGSEKLHKKTIQLESTDARYYVVRFDTRALENKGIAWLSVQPPDEGERKKQPFFYAIERKLCYDDEHKAITWDYPCLIGTKLVMLYFVCPYGCSKLSAHKRERSSSFSVAPKK